MKPITYFVDNVAIRSLCANYGDYLADLSIADRLALVKGLSECLLHVVGYNQDCLVLTACKAEGHVFGDGVVQDQIRIEGVIESIDNETATPHEAAQLLTAILQTIYPL